MIDGRCDDLAEAIDLADWRRRVAELWAAWRAGCTVDPAGATATWRAGRDELFTSHPQSPLPPAGRATFAGVPTWPYDPAWRLYARFEPDPELGPTTGLARPSWSRPSDVAMRRIGHVDLSGPLAGERLAVYRLDTYTGGLFIPLRDATSGRETYGAGRYLLDTAKSADHGLDPETGELVLDFNLAYHPSCAYDTRWTCPIAPAENRLLAAVNVGDRLA